MPNPPALGAEKTAPVEETETISKSELARLRTQANNAGGAQRLLDETTKELNAIKGQRELEERVKSVAETYQVNPTLLAKIAPKLTKEELEEFAKDLPQVEENPRTLIPDSGRTSGSVGSLSVEQIRTMSMEDYAKSRKELWNKVKEGKIK